MTLALTAILGCVAKDPGQRNEAVTCAPDPHEVQAFLLACIEAVNPKSEEDPEDLVRACRGTLVHAFCGLGCYESPYTGSLATIYCTRSRSPELLEVTKR